MSAILSTLANLPWASTALYTGMAGLGGLSFRGGYALGERALAPPKAERLAAMADAYTKGPISETATQVGEVGGKLVAEGGKQAQEVVSATIQGLTDNAEKIAEGVAKGVAKHSDVISNSVAKSISAQVPAGIIDGVTEGLEKVANKFGSSFALPVWGLTIIAPLTAFIHANATAASRRDDILLKSSLMRGNIFTAAFTGLAGASLWNFVINREKKAAHDLEKNAVA